LYDDGDEETLNLLKEKWKLIEAGSDADEVGLRHFFIHQIFSARKLIAIISLDRRDKVIVKVLMLPLICMFYG